MDYIAPSEETDQPDSGQSARMHRLIWLAHVVL